MPGDGTRRRGGASPAGGRAGERGRDGRDRTVLQEQEHGVPGVHVPPVQAAAGGGRGGDNVRRAAVAGGSGRHSAKPRFLVIPSTIFALLVQLPILTNERTAGTKFLSL